MKLLMRGTSGLNNVVDPARLNCDPKTGVCELAAAVNVDIDNRGRPIRRKGRTQRHASGGHSLFSDGGTCLYVSDGGLYQIAGDFSRRLVRSGISGSKMRYVQVATRTYYSNEGQRGFVEGGSDNAWEAPGTTEDDREFSVPASGRHLEVFGGRLLVSVGPIVYASEPQDFHRFDMTHTLLPFGADVTMLKTAGSVLYVSDTSSIYAVFGPWQDMRVEKVAGYPAIEDTACLVFGFGELGDGVLFTTTEGICYGGKDGVLRNITKGRLLVPSSSGGTAVLREDDYTALLTG